MKIIAIAASTLALVLATAVGASAAKYKAPKIDDAYAYKCDRLSPEKNMMVSVYWDNPRGGTGFTVVKYSTSKKFKNAQYMRPKDHGAQFGGWGPAPVKNDEAYRVDGLKKSTRYYFKVAVSTYEGKRLSSYSKVVSAKTKSC